MRDEGDGRGWNREREGHSFRRERGVGEFRVSDKGGFRVVRIYTVKKFHASWAQVVGPSIKRTLGINFFGPQTGPV